MSVYELVSRDLEVSLILFREIDDKRDQLYARVLYSGHPVRTIHGTLDWLPLSKLIEILKPYVLKDIKSFCDCLEGQPCRLRLQGPAT